jgi:hypothetical protein
MSDRCQKAEQLSVAEERPNELEVVQVGTAVIGIVEDEHISIREIALGLVDHGLDGKRHGANEDRQAALSLHQRFSIVFVIQPVSGVVRLGDDGIEGRAEQGGVHLVCNLFKPTVENGECHGIDHQNSSIVCAGLQDGRGCCGGGVLVQPVRSCSFAE